MKGLPTAARLYVAAVMIAGVVVLVTFGRSPIHNLTLFAGLLILSSLASAFKVILPLTPSGSTMSVSHAVDFASLLLLGADATMWVAAASAWAQCTFRTQALGPAYRTLFSMASLVVTVKVTGVVYTALGGPP